MQFKDKEKTVSSDKNYTGRGDDGQTEIITGQRISKNDTKIHFIGTVDELNCHLGLIKAMLSNEDAWQYLWLSACQFIERTQKNLMRIISHVLDCNDKRYSFCDKELVHLENEIYKLTKNLSKINEFVIPGKNIIEAQIQITRTVTRRAERFYACAAEKQPLCSCAGKYLNRLSVYLFALSQQESQVNDNFINQITGI
jgi:cob(I)alamin adenosyltransferase